MRCACYIINLCIRDVLHNLKGQVSKLRELVKAARNSRALRNEFKNMQVKLGWTSIQELLSLDVPTKWNPTFEMIERCWKALDVLNSLYNLPQSSKKLKGFLLTDEE